MRVFFVVRFYYEQQYKCGIANGVDGARDSDDQRLVWELRKDDQRL